MTSSKNRDIWNTLKSFDSWWCAVFIEGFSSRRLTVDVNFIATSCCKAEEYAECFVSCDQGALVNGCDFYFCGINPIDRLKLFWKLVCLLFLGKITLPNIGAFLKCHKMSQKNDDNFPHITCSSVRNHMIWHFWRSFSFKTISLMSQELSTFVEKCHDKFVGYFCEPNGGKTEHFLPRWQNSLRRRLRGYVALWWYTELARTNKNQFCTLGIFI